jgi:hypothetical protein
VRFSELGQAQPSGSIAEQACPIDLYLQIGNLLTVFSKPQQNIRDTTMHCPILTIPEHHLIPVTASAQVASPCHI